ncbi:hypothetical protein B0A49_10671 [Cryomyces minteri]|uniref:Uncharacterized protein n=1 Tax=Cryomyces minteri TaxID=331657 RepID=A0A4U0WI95_9PEZI|nr:hypothetical protein B0A49_10671 [Cryomyces minteri]
MHSTTAALAVFLGAALATPLEHVARDTCGSNYIACSPPGATSNRAPAVGSGLASLYTDLLTSVRGITFSSKRDVSSLGRRANSASVCCAQGTQCLLLANLNVPFCYDKFTTNYFLPDGSYGQIASGAFTSADGSTANLLTGDYTSNSTSGNVYSASPADKPNTSTLSIPPQWTSSGVGSAIPITNLAQVFTYTTTVSATTIQATTYPATTIGASTIPASTMGASTIPASTAAASIVSGSTVQPATTISAQTFQASTRQASTVPASSKAASTVEPTTVTAHTTVVTSTAVGSTPSGTAAVAAASHTGAANAADVKSAAGMALVGVAAFAIFAL